MSLTINQTHLIFPTFRIKLQIPITIHLQPDEHTKYRWVTKEECHQMNNLIHGLHDLLEKLGNTLPHK